MQWRNRMGGFCCRWSDRAMVLSILAHILAKKCFVTKLPVGVFFMKKEAGINMNITGCYVGRTKVEF
jgi:hypothetical protein